MGIDLVNNLMTARKVSERALSGAALPTVEKFYEITDENCPYTNFSFSQMRDQIFAGAKSRSDFDDYPRFARIFAAILRTIVTNEEAKVVDTLKRGFKEIDPDFSFPDDKEIEEYIAPVLPEDMLKHLSLKTRIQAGY